MTPGGQPKTSHLWAAVALRSGGLPPVAVVRTWTMRFAPKCVLTESLRPEDDGGAERTLIFHESGAEVGAAHFPWSVAGRGKTAFGPHQSHVFFSLRVPGPGAIGRRSLARAAGAVAATSDTAFVWWGRTGGIYKARDFLKRVEGHA